MSHSPERMWQLVIQGSDQLAEELGLAAPPPIFTPARLLGAIDGWLAERDEPLDEEETAQLGCLLARLLVETHGGGLVQIRAPKHPLAGEWAIAGFERGLARDYHVPFVVSAVRIGVDRSLTAAQWYAQCLAEGR
jgi:hypothetical protein